MTLRLSFRLAQIFIELRQQRNVLRAVSLFRLLVGFITHGVIILALRTFWIYNCSQIPLPLLSTVIDI